MNGIWFSWVRGPLAAAGLGAAYRHHCGVVFPSHASDGCPEIQIRIDLLRFYMLEFAIFQNPNNGATRCYSAVHPDVEIGYSRCALTRKNHQWRYVILFHKHIFPSCSLCALIVVLQELSTTLLILQDANDLFWSVDSIDRIAKFSAEEWDDLFLAIAKVFFCTFCVCTFNFIQLIPRAINRSLSIVPKFANFLRQWKSWIPSFEVLRSFYFLLQAKTT